MKIINKILNAKNVILFYLIVMPLAALYEYNNERYLSLALSIGLFTIAVIAYIYFCNKNKNKVKE